MSTFHPEIDGHSHADIISIATVTKIWRLWIWLGHVPVTMCMSACVHLSVCMGVRTCVCVRTSMYVWILKICGYVFISSSYGIRMCLCIRVTIRWIFYLYSSWCAVTLHLPYDYPSQVSNDTASIRMYNIHYYYSLQDRWDILLWAAAGGSITRNI